MLKLIYFFLGILLTASAAQAEVKRLNVPLVWQDIPRSAEVKVHAVAKIPGGYVEFYQFLSTPNYSYEFHFDSGVSCFTVSNSSRYMVLQCAENKTGLWDLRRDPREGNATLDWVFDDVKAVKGEELR